MRKHHQLLQKKKEVFFPIKRKDNNIESDSSKGNRTELDAIDSQQVIKSSNLHELNFEARSDFIHTKEVAVIKQFLSQLDIESFYDSNVKEDKVLHSSLFSLGKVNLDTREKIVTLENCALYTKKTTLRENLTLL